MFAKLSGGLVVILALIFALAGWGGAAAPIPETGGPPQPGQAGPDDLRPANISFIDSPTPTCYRPALQSNTCFINWSSMDVSTASPQTVVSMTLTIDNRVRANYQGYFQSSIQISPAFHGAGFQAPCGPAGVDGIPGKGHAYDWTLKARDSAGLETSNNGTVICPALDPIHVFLPVVVR